MSGLLLSMQTFSVALKPSLCWEWELRGTVNKGRVPGRLALWSPCFQMKTLLIWNTRRHLRETTPFTMKKKKNDRWGETVLFEVPRMTVLASRSFFKPNGSLATDELWACVSFSSPSPPRGVTFWFVVFWNGCVLSPPISVINWRSREEGVCKQMDRQNDYVAVSKTWGLAIHFM